MIDNLFPPHKHWLRHIAAVPKGFLRLQVLELLSEGPKSGSEIINEIERRTGGLWRPSPGSVYPLLAWLQDSGYIREVPSGEPGIKRYTLTEKGKQLLEEQRRSYELFSAGKALFALPLASGLLMRIPPERSEELKNSLINFFRALIGLGLALGERFDEEALREALAILNEAAEKLRGIEKRVRGR